MKLILLRHTRVDVPHGLCYGQLDVPLHPNYPEERLRIQQSLPFTHWGGIYSSPLQRCRRLAEDLALGLPVTLEHRLQELNFGLWEGRLWSEITPAESQEWTEDFVTRSPPQGESYEFLWQRVQDFLNELKQSPPEDPLLIVTHSGVMRAIRCWIEQRPLRDAFSVPLDYGEWWPMDLS